MNDRVNVQAAYYCCAEVYRRRVRLGQPVPQWLKDHFRDLDTQVRMSRLRHESGGDERQLKREKLISAREAADILVMSKRQVQRLAADLDGEIVDGRWLFNEATVLAYAEAQGDGLSTSCA